MLKVIAFLKFYHFAVLGIVVESPQRGTSEDLERIARAEGNAQVLMSEGVN